MLIVVGTADTLSEILDELRTQENFWPGHMACLARVGVFIHDVWRSGLWCG